MGLLFTGFSVIAVNQSWDGIIGFYVNRLPNPTTPGLKATNATCIVRNPGLNCDPRALSFQV